MRDEASGAGASGALGGLSGGERRALGRGWLLGMTLAGAIILFNIVSRGHDAPEHGLVAPVIDEGSSAVAIALALAVPALAALWMRRARPAPAMAVAVNVLAALTFCVIHVGGFVALRKLAFPLWLGEPYSFGALSRELPYEFFKDAVAYGLATAGFWAVLRRAPVGASTALAAPRNAILDIRDGSRLVRAPLSEVLAVRSAGNYAEVLLSDGRRPLMRTSLAGLQARLAPEGFVRTHRSWLVNAARVTGLRPEGSGDYAVELGALEAPLSRRFPEALALLRGGR